MLRFVIQVRDSMFATRGQHRHTGSETLNVESLILKALILIIERRDFQLSSDKRNN